MWKTLTLALTVLLFLPQFGQTQEARSVLEGVSKAMGATDVNSIQYSGSGTTFAVGQSPAPGAPWPRFNVKSYTRVINYETASLRDEIVRTQAENPPRGGGGQPVRGEQRQVLLVSGTMPGISRGTPPRRPLWPCPTACINSGLPPTA
jgi:hypothetical protein